MAAAALWCGVGVVWCGWCPTPTDIHTRRGQASRAGQKPAVDEEEEEEDEAVATPDDDDDGTACGCRFVAWDLAAGHEK